VKKKTNNEAIKKFVEEFRQRRGRMPMLREVAEAFHISIPTAQFHFKKLQIRTGKELLSEKLVKLFEEEQEVLPNHWKQIKIWLENFAKWLVDK